MKRLLIVLAVLPLFFACGGDEKIVEVPVKEVVRDTVIVKSRDTVFIEKIFKDTITLTLRDTIVKNVTDTIVQFSFPHLKGKAKEFMEKNPYSVNRMMKKVWNEYAVGSLPRITVVAYWYYLNGSPAVYVVSYDNISTDYRSITYRMKGYMIFNPKTEKILFKRKFDPNSSYSHSEFFDGNFIVNSQVLMVHTNATKQAFSPY